MRTRRQFRPMFDLMPSRITPSTGALPDPMDAIVVPTETTTPMVTPMDPLTIPTGTDPSGIPVLMPSSPTIADPTTITITC